MARRGWREGSVCRRTVIRGENEYAYWRAVVSLGTDPSGRRIRKEYQARTERAARTWLKATVARYDRGLPVRGTGVTVGTYAVDWLRDTTLNVKPATVSFYRAALYHVEDLANLPLTALTTAHVRDLIARKTDSGLSTRTVRGIVQTLALVLRRAMGDGLVDRNVASLVQLPKLNQAEPRHFTAEQARRFLEVTKDDELGSLYAVAIGTGLRRGELLGLTYGDVDQRNGVVRVRSGKTRAAIRVVPLPSFALEAVLRHPRRDVGPIWPVSPSYVSRHFQELCRKAGVPVLTMHSTRHTAASLMLDAGVPIEVIRSILGHTTVSMASHYARPGDDLRRDAVERLGRMVG